MKKAICAITMALVLNAATPGRVEATQSSATVRNWIQQIERRIQQVEQELAEHKSKPRDSFSFRHATDEDIYLIRGSMRATLVRLHNHKESLHEQYRRAVEREQARAQQGR